MSVMEMFEAVAFIFVRDFVDGSFLRVAILERGMESVFC